MAKLFGTWKIDDTEIPTPAHGITQSVNKIWSSNTGRNTSGKMLGTLIAVKRKIEITWPVLTNVQLSAISDIVDSTTSWHKLTYYDMFSGKVKTYEGYFGDGSGVLYGQNVRGSIIITGYKIDFIER